MLSFENDYSEGCHPVILEALARTNYQSEPGYGADSFTLHAKDLLRQACEAPEADVYFLNGGTQTNRIAISTMLQPYQGVIAPRSGHICDHEAGAIEHAGCKVLSLPSHQGKLCPKEVEAYVKQYYADPFHEHIIYPGMVYISQPTEFGTLYTASELEALSSICRAYDMYLYMDGARLGYGLEAEGTDVDLPLIARLCDGFYIGGTKMGTLSGEALVFPKGNAPDHFLTRIKQQGALSAKGRLFGVQFETLFTDGLYYQAGKHAIAMAKKLRLMFEELGIRFYLDSPTNQQFVILKNGLYEKLQQQVRCTYWEPYDENHTVVRFVTCWATRQEDIDALRQILSSL